MTSFVAASVAVPALASGRASEAAAAMHLDLANDPPPMEGALHPQGFLPPDFSLEHLNLRLQQVVDASQSAADASAVAAKQIAAAAVAGDQAALNSERVQRLPGTISVP